ncbi:hypothetical protein [Paenibacillus elgii]|uniref:hypothetical protein n=1 Tax=Paenibacillus elgii TaxID=189691 RepID=UPI001112BE3A|nr:hypothetical protein [Paenibacillus elgii]
MPSNLALHKGELRSIISEGINEIGLADEESFREVINQVISNLTSMFKKHRKELDDLSKSKRKFYGIDLSCCLVSGGLSIAAAVTSNPTISQLSTISSFVLGAPSIKELIKDGNKIIKTSKELRKSPTSILLKYSK